MRLRQWEMGLLGIEEIKFKFIYLILKKRPLDPRVRVWVFFSNLDPNPLNLNGSESDGSIFLGPKSVKTDTDPHILLAFELLSRM